MRSSKGWNKALVKELKRFWDNENGFTNDLTPSKFSEIELGICAVQHLLPGESAGSLSALLTGYSFVLPQTKDWQQQEYHILYNTRVIVHFYKNQRYWQRQLALYMSVPERLRLFDVKLKTLQIVSREAKLSVCANRIELYEKTLTTKLPYFQDKLEWATTGRYIVPTGRNRLATVEIDQQLSEQLTLHPVSPHDLTKAFKQRNKPLRALVVAWAELLKTAAWMDEQEKLNSIADDSRGNWYVRLKRVQLQIFDKTGLQLITAKKLVIEGLLHLVGMVSSGKSTLMDVLAVWMARQNKRVTLVVGDVVSVLNRVQQFKRLGVSCAPILGNSNREKHTNRLHRVVQSEHPAQPLYQTHQGFEVLSTTCPLDGLLDTNRPFETKPCLKLRLAKVKPGLDDEPEFETEAENTSDKVELEDLDVNNNNHEGQQREKICPLYSICPVHKAQRELVSASIWVATPASLVYSRLAQPVNSERIRFLELAYLTSDLIIVDEADLVQVQLDIAFSPSQTLISRGSHAWFNNLRERVVQQLSREGRRQLGQLEVNEWCQVHDIAHTAADRIYGMLLKDSVLRNWVSSHYFTSWGLFEKLALELSGAPEGTSPNPASRAKYTEFSELLNLFEEYLTDPLGERLQKPLAELSRQVITVADTQTVQSRISDWLEALLNKLGLKISQIALNRGTVKLHFVLALAILEDRLDYLLRNWKQVEEELRLDSASSLLFHRPPEDYAAIIPEAPMANLLGFQYLNFGNDKDTPGDLRFFRCSGVGRWLLLHLHELFKAEEIYGPNVLLLSATSWAGNSPSYHLQVPPGGVLKAPKEELDAIRQSNFEFLPFQDANGHSIRVSGLTGSRREDALKQILYQMTQIKNTGSGVTSQLEVIQADLALGRQRILLLVGSYEEALAARLYLEQIRPEWRGQVLNLVPDDEEFDNEWQSSLASGNLNNSTAIHRRDLRRGLLQQFASTGAWILIAPLLAVERGHNILNEESVAAIGAAFFLVRPHPRPDDINQAIYSINQWAIETTSNITRWLAEGPARGDQSDSTNKALDLTRMSYEEVAQQFRKAAFSRWIYLLQLPLVYSTLPPQERSAHIWSQLVVIWQVIGRLVRGGKPAKVYFCDASFMRRAAEFSEEEDVSSTSLLTGIYEELRPYFESLNKNTSRTANATHEFNNGRKPPSQTEQLLAQTLFSPLYEALLRMLGK